MDTKKRILILAHSPDMGGAELALKGLIDSLNDKYIFTVVIPSDKVVDSKVKNSNVTYKYLPLPWWCYEKHSEAPRLVKKELLDNYAMLVDLAKEHDILLTNTLTIPWLGFAANEVNTPHIWYVHEFGDIDHNLQFVLGYDNTLAAINSLSSRVLTISDAVLEHISKGISKDKIDIIHQAINLEKVINIKPLVKNDPIKLLCMGAIKPSKGQHIAIDAVKLLANLGYDVTLDIVGPNANEPYVGKLREAVKGVQKISLEVRSYDISKELSAHHALLMCSDNEALGRVTIEAMAAGTPVIGFASPSTKYLLDNNRGALYIKNTPQDLCQTLISFINGSLTINTKAAKKFAIDTYNPSVQAQDFIDSANKASCVGDDQKMIFTNYIHTLEINEFFISTQNKHARKIKEKIVRSIPSAVKKPIKNIVRKITSV